MSRIRRLETKEEDMKRISTLIALVALAAALGVSTQPPQRKRAGHPRIPARRVSPVPA